MSKQVLKVKIESEVPDIKKETTIQVDNTSQYKTLFLSQRKAFKGKAFGNEDELEIQVSDGVLIFGGINVPKEIVGIIKEFINQAE